MKIVYVSPNAELGGAEKILELLLKYHDRQRFEIHVYFLNSGPLIEKWKKEGIHIHVASSPFRFRQLFRLWRAQWEFKKFLVRENIDLVHSTMSYGHLFAGLPALWAKVPEIWFQHGPVGTTWDFWAAKIPTEQILYNSHFTATEQGKNGKTLGVVVHGPVEIPAPDFFEDSQLLRKKFRERWKFSDQNFVCLHVARMDRWKGQMEFVRAVQEAHGRNPQIRGVLVGGAALGQESYEQEIHHWVREQGLQEVIYFAGFLNPVDEAFYGADVFIHTSTQPEPLGLTILEAMARHCPVIASPRGGPAEIISDGRTGFLIEPVDFQKISTRILELVDPNSGRRQMVEKAFQEVQKYEAGSWVKKMEGIYQQRIKSDA